MSLLATTGFDACPRDIDVLFVPGGDGTPGQTRDEATLDFLRERAARAAWVTSVCTGSLILGAAGLLAGYVMYYNDYNFVRLLAKLRMSPAMDAGVSDRLWEISDIVALVEAADQRPIKRGPYKKSKSQLPREAEIYL